MIDASIPHKVIETKFLGPTTNRGARIKASDNNGNSITRGYPHELSGAQCHLHVAATLQEKMGWEGQLVGGWTKQGCAFVLVPESEVRA